MDALAKRLIADEEGADLLEYALLLGLLSCACFLAMETLGSGLNAMFTSVATRLSGILP